MPGRLILTETPESLAAAFSTNPPRAGDCAPRRNIAPGQEILALTADQGFVPMRWGMIPVGRVNARGRPVMETIVNARSETVFSKAAFEGVRRCLVPANGWYEWTGPPRRKTAWRIGYPDGRVMAFAAICDLWTAPGGRELWQVATLTCEPNADVRDIHDRMGVILTPGNFSSWLQGDVAEAAALMAPLPDGMLKVEPAGDVDWSGP